MIRARIPTRYDDDGAITAAWAGIVGRDGIKPNTWYALAGGEPKEVA